jgi:hypothetical protein
VVWFDHINEIRSNLPWSDAMSDSEDDTQKEAEGSYRHVSNSKIRVSSTKWGGGSNDYGFRSSKLSNIEI